MGCVTSKKNGEAEDQGVVSLCKERKKLLKLALERRYALGDAQNKFNQSLFAVAAAIRLFVARNSSPSSPFLITFPEFPTVDDSGEDSITKPMFLKQIPTESTHKVASFSTQERDDGDGDEEEEDSVLCEHFFGEGNRKPAVESAPEDDLGWDFFNPFDGFEESREKEGIPDVEEDKDSIFKVEEEEKMEKKNQSQEIENGSLRMIEKGRGLLEALKDVEDHFVKSYNSGLDVSKMLETSKIHLLSGMEELKESSNKLIRSITWSRNSRSSLSRSSSSRSLRSCSSRSSFASVDFKNDVFDDYGGMESGSHSSTLGRLYAWERKLYQEVKVGEESRKIYERKCSQLRNGGELSDRYKTRIEVRDLNSRILVALRSAEAISERIQKLRDEELQPQVIELLHGLKRNWKMMLECSETQMRIMSEVRSFDCASYGKLSDDSHRLATLQLEAELHNWRICFAAYVSAQKAYVEALLGWLSKLIAPEEDKPLLPPLVVICRNWLALLGKLPSEAVVRAMSGIRKDIRAVWIQQGEEKQQKRKADGLAKELEKRVLAFQRTESRILESKLSDNQGGLEGNVRSRIEDLAGRKTQLEMFEMRVGVEKGKHQASIEETQRITVNGFKTGLCSLFESLIEFSNASLKIYDELVSNSGSPKVEDKVCKTDRKSVV